MWSQRRKRSPRRGLQTTGGVYSGRGRLENKRSVSTSTAGPNLFFACKIARFRQPHEISDTILMAGKRRKHPDALAFRRAGRYRPLVIAEGERPVLPCPEGVVAKAKEAWEQLWRSPLRRAYEDSDLPALHRWLWWYDQWLRTAEQISQTGPTRRGARGDVVLRSSTRYLRLCEAGLQSLEEALGMTPLSRM